MSMGMTADNKYNTYAGNTGKGKRGFVSGVESTVWASDMSTKYWIPVSGTFTEKRVSQEITIPEDGLYLLSITVYTAWASASSQAEAGFACLPNVLNAAYSVLNPQGAGFPGQMAHNTVIMPFKKGTVLTFWGSVAAGSVTTDTAYRFSASVKKLKEVFE